MWFGNLYLRLVRDHQPVLWLVAIAASMAAGGGVTRLRFEDDPRNLYRQHNEEFAALEQLQEEFGTFDDEVLVLVTGEIFSDSGIANVRRLANRIRETEGVLEVISLLDMRRSGSKLVPLVPYETSPDRLERAREEASRHPIVADRLLSRDGRATLVVVKLRGPWPTIRDLQPIVAEIRTATRDVNAAGVLRATMSGMPVVRLDSLASVQREQLKFTLLALLVAMAISWFVFRQLAAVTIATLAPVLGTFWSLGVMGWLGVSINGFNMLLPTLVLVLGFTDTLHVVADIRRGLGYGWSRRQAAVSAVEHLSVACFLTSFTTAIGFASLSLSRTVSIREFGWVCACGAALSFLAVILLTPLLACTALGKFLDPRRGSRRQTMLPMLSQPAKLAFALRLPRTRIVAAVVFLILLAPLGFQLTADVQTTEAIPESSETVQTLRDCDASFGGSLPVLLVFEWPSGTDFLSAEVISVLEELHGILRNSHKMGRPFSILNVLQTMPGRSTISELERYLARFPPELRRSLLRRDLRKLVIICRVPDRGASSLYATLKPLEAQVQDLEVRHPGFRIQVTGNAVIAGKNLRQIIGDLAKSLAFAAVVIVAVLTFVFRSLALGLISVIPNILPLVTNAAVLKVCDLPLQLTSVVTFSLCLGIAVDDTVHFLIRFQRERRAGWSVGAALLRSYYYVGHVLIATSAVLGGGFAVIALSSVPALRLFACLACTSLLVALIGDLVVLPALLQCCAKRSANDHATR